MKKIMAFLLVLTMLLALVACGGLNDDSDETSNDSKTSDESEKYELRLPENVKYRYQANDGYTDMTVTKIGDEYCIDNGGQITFYRKNDLGTYTSWLWASDHWASYSTGFDDTMMGILIGIGAFNTDYDSMDKTGEDTVCGVSVGVYKDKYLDAHYYIHSGSDGEFFMKSVVGSATAEVTEWTTQNVAFEMDKPE